VDDVPHPLRNRPAAANVATVRREDELLDNFHHFLVRFVVGITEFYDVTT
jgi:hypothetical protein